MAPPRHSAGRGGSYPPSRPGGSYFGDSGSPYFGGVDSPPFGLAYEDPGELPQTPPPPPTRRRLGEVLIAQGVITPEDLHRALEAQAQNPPGTPHRRLGVVVVEMGLVDERRLAAALAEALGLDVIDLASSPIDTGAARMVPRAVCERHGVLVVGRSPGGVRVATTDPTNVVAIDDVKLYTGASDVAVYVAVENQLREQIRRIWSLSENSSEVATLLDDIDTDTEPAQGPAGPDPATDVTDAPVVRLVGELYADAVRLGASDIHIEPQFGDLRVRFRIDGLLRDVMTAPKRVAGAVVSRIKVTAGLDIAERRRPQDGRTRLQVDGHVVDARISTLPTMHGEKVVIRLLAGGDEVPPLAHIGLDERQRDTLLSALLTPQGLVLITGPTGSGKTHTLYSAIQQVRTPDRNIVTLEDPVEIQITGISQVQVNERAGLTFSRGLRSILRQDPDIVLVGESRDLETAELALQASLTGHLVLTTLHTNDAVSAVTRLVDMGVEPFLVASSLTAAVAQRLVRTPCPGCVAPYRPNPRTLALLGLVEADLGTANPRRGRGCVDCGGTGYRGRIGIFEVLPITASIRKVLLSSPTEEALRAAARTAGLVTLRAAGLRKAHAGETTYEEVLRVTHVDASEGTHCRTCEHALDDEMVVCPWCGTDVHRGTCQNCRRQLDPEWRVCPFCRTPVPRETAEDGGGLVTARVLIVTPEAESRGRMAKALSEEFEVDHLGTAEEALAAIARERYDGLVLALDLPDLTGIEVIRLLRSDPATATLPVLLVGAGSTEDLGAMARTAGADDHLTVPIDPGQLEDRVSRLVVRSPRWMASRPDHAPGRDWPRS